MPSVSSRCTVMLVSVMPTAPISVIEHDIRYVGALLLAVVILMFAFASSTASRIGTLLVSAAFITAIVLIASTSPVYFPSVPTTPTPRAFVMWR